MGDCFAKYARNDMNRQMPFVTNLIMIMFLNAPAMGRFYLFFMRLLKFFVTVLCGLVSIGLNVR